MSISKAPKLNEPVTLTLTISSALDAPDSKTAIELPEGTIKIGGNLSWEGDLSKNVPVQISAEIKFIQGGDWAIKGSAKHIIDEDNSWGDADYIYLGTNETFGKLGYCEPGPGEGVETIGPEGEKTEREKSEQIKEEHEACPEGYFWNEIS
ncbi:hypothetical protein HYW19_02575 [Candidatus Woesearchaeota archaeon]|nr:hypothetical protein [Candidatus Woesearchaeota archaeon]